jgi:hypothetical protein
MRYCFLFFGAAARWGCGAQRTTQAQTELRTHLFIRRGAEKQKDNGVDGLCVYKQATPTGFAPNRAVSAVPSGLSGVFASLPNLERLGYCPPSLRDFKRRAGLVAGLFICLLVANTVFGQALYLSRYQEPQLFPTPRVTQASVGGYAEGTYDQSTFQNSSTSVSHVHFFAGPTLGLSLEGSIYHPNFLTYALNTDGAFGWTRDEFRSINYPASARDEFEYLGHFGFSMELLPSKPYHATFFVENSHDYRDNDFFNRVTVDSWRYGARAGWRLGRWDLNADFYHRDETDSSVFPVAIGGSTTFNQNTVTHEDVLALTARNERDRGGTSLNYTWDQYTRSDAGRLGTGEDQSVALGDNERFGAHDTARLNNTASFFHRDAVTDRNDEFLADSTLSIDHTLNLNSFYNFSYDRFTMPDFHSDSFVGQAGIQHQLYDSLHSTFFVHGSDYSTAASDSSSDMRRIGAGISEAYTKMLSADHRLRLSTTLLVDHTEQETSASQQVSVHDERHSFTEGGGLGLSFVLNLRDVIESSISITDDHDTQPGYLADFDYRVVQNGPQTTIERLTGSRIGTNAIVHVSYRAAATPSGSYDTIGESSEIRLELWQNLLAIYARVNLSQNNAPADLRIQEVTAYTFGTEVTWNWLRTGAQYIIYDSTQSHYRSAQLYQSATFHLDPESTCGIDFTEGWIDYLDAHRQEQDYRAILRYSRQLTHRWGLNVDGGVSYRQGNGVDQVLATFRPSLKYVIGKLSLDAGYDYEYELFLNSEERQKHMFFIRMKRFF